METLTFKSNIKCMGCVAKVTPYLNELAGESNWSVDVNDPTKVLKVKGELTEAQIQEAIKKAGFSVERI